VKTNDSKSNPEWEWNISHIRPIADKMIVAGWMKGYIVSKDGMTYSWTQKGIAKIKQLSDMWNELSAATFDPQYSNFFWLIVLRAAVENGIRKSIK
jgi:hypothetical protein